MGRFRVLIKPSAKKELIAVATKKDRQRIVRRIQSLSETPRPPGSHKLSGYDRYRIRQGHYRIVYEIHDLEVTVIVIKITPRREVYRHR